MVFLVGCSAQGATPTQSTPQTGVVIDGNGGDWQSYPLSITDAQGDQASGTPDLGEVRAFSNDHFFYLSIQLHGEGSTDHYDVLMDVDGGEFDYQVSFWPRQNQAVFAEYPVTAEMKPEVSIRSAQGEVIELKMPLSVVGDQAVRSVMVQTWMEGVVGDQAGDGQVAVVNEADPEITAARVSPATDSPVPQLTPGPITERLGHVQLSGSNAPADYAYRAFLQIPVGVAWGADGFLYVADWTGRHVVRVAKDGTMDDLPFWNPAWTTGYDGPRDVAFDSHGTLYVNDHDRIFRVDTDGSVTELEGVLPNPQEGPLGSLAISPKDELYYSDRAQGGALYKWTPASGRELVLEGLSSPDDMVFGLDGTLFVTQRPQGQVLKVDLTTGAVSTFDRGCLR